MKQYVDQFTSTTPQSRPIPETHQVRNRAGGYVFEVDDRTRLLRFLILGTVEGSYYASGRELTREAMTAIDRLLEGGDGAFVLDAIRDVSVNGRAPKQDPAIFALAMALKAGDVETRRAAAKLVPEVCRTFSHIASLIEAIPAFSKAKKDTWGPVTVRAIRNWFASKDNEGLAYQFIKYRNRQGWTARDLIRLSHYHVDAWDKHRNSLIRWMLGKGGFDWPEAAPQLHAFIEVQTEKDPKKVAKLVADHRLPWEAVPSEFARNLDVQWALMANMPPGALVRQLGRLSSIGLLVHGSAAVTHVNRVLGNEVRMSKARMHPMALYLASKVYASGRGVRGKLTWNAVPQVVSALSGAFVRSFGAVTPSGRKIVVGVDCSGSMVNSPDIGGIPGFKSAEAAFMAAWVTARTEPNASFVAFDEHAEEFNFHGVETLDQVNALAGRMMARLGGGTDCSQPILHNYGTAGVQAYVVYTDAETWRGSIHPMEAVSQYRDRYGDRTKLVTVGFVSHGYSLRGQRDDAGSLDVVGYDEGAPSVVADFISRD